MTEGAAHGIKVNAVMPAAITRMAGRSADETEALDAADATTSAAMAPELVAPMVAFLAHEDCPVSGEIYAAGGGRFARIFIAMTPGYVQPSPRRRSRTSRSTGRRSTTRPATTSRPTSWTGRPRS